MLHGSRVALGRSPWIEAIKQLQSRSFSHSKDEDSVEDFNKVRMYFRFLPFPIF
jgi:hypothetical protein